MRTSNQLKSVELAKVVLRLNVLKEELSQSRPQVSEVAERLAKELGFTVTKHNILHLIYGGAIPDFRPEPMPHQKRLSDSSDLQSEIAELRKRIERLEVELGVGKVSEKIKKAM